MTSSAASLDQGGGAGVAAGGAHVAEVCRRLLLGEDLPDARIYMDLNEQLTHAPLR